MAGATVAARGLRVRLAACLAAAALVPAAIAEATPCNPGCTVCWKQPVSGSWNQDSNWNSGRVPVPDDVVCIDRDGTYTVTAGEGPITVAGLKVEACSGRAALEVTGIRFNLDGDGTIGCGGEVDLVDAVLAAATGTTVHNQGVLVLDAGTLVATLDNTGMVDGRGAGPMLIDGSGGGVVNGAAATVRVRQSVLELRLGADALFSNAGALEIGAPPSPVAANAQVVVTGGRFDPEGGSISGPGRLRLDGTAVTGDLALTDPALAIELVGASLPMDSSLSNRSRLVIEGDLLVGGTLVNGDGALLVLQGSAAAGDARLVVGRALSNAGTVLLDNGDQRPRDVTIETQGGPLTNQGGGLIMALAGGGGLRRLTGGLLNSGRVLVDGPPLVVEGPEFANAGGGSLEVEGGELVLLLGSPGIAKAGPQFTSSGNIALAPGTRVRIRGSGGRGLVGSHAAVAKAAGLFINAGTIETGLGSELSVAGLGFENAPTGVLAGDGTFDFEEATDALNRGRLSPGLSPGVLTVVGDLPLSGTSLLDLELAGRAVGSEYDRLQVNGAVGLAGDLEVSLLASFQPRDGDRFEVLGFTSASGDLDGVGLPDLGHALDWEVDRQPGSLALLVVCNGPRLQLSVVPDKDPVSLGYDLVHDVVIRNDGALPATGVTLTAGLPSSLRFVPELSAGGCFDSGGRIECSLDEVPGQQWVTLPVAVEPLQAGELVTAFQLAQQECIPDPAGYTDAVQVRVTTARPCDADADGSVTGRDLPAAVGHVFGVEAAGNPDCRVGGGVNAADLAAIAARATVTTRKRSGILERVTP